MSDQKKLIVVLGPHRSGTSLCAAALECLGAELCLPEQYSNEENQKGFFEHPEIVAFNDRLLAHLGGAWDNPQFDGPAVIAKMDLMQWRVEASRLFEEVYGAAQTVAIKDPRLCQLLDFWIQVFIGCGYTERNIFIVYVLRSPVEVALSQQHRAKDNPAYYEIGNHLIEGAALWLSLTAQALAQTRERQRFFVSYPELLSTPELTLGKIAEFVGLRPDQQQVVDFCDSFVDTSLYRSVANTEAFEFLARELPRVMEFDATLQALSGSGSSFQQDIDRALDIFKEPDTQLAIAHAIAPAISRLSERLRGLEHSADIIADLEKQVSEYSSVISPLRTQVSRLENGNTNLQQQLETQGAEIRNLHSVIHERENIIGEMEASTSWKISKPVRTLGAFRKRVLEKVLARTAKYRLHAIYKYQHMSVRNPRFAWASRVALRPLFRLISAFLSRNGDLISGKRYANQLNSMLYQQMAYSDDYLPFISIIVPNYNHSAYLPLRLDSIYAQTYQNFEVILLDDASTDESREVLVRYQQEHPQNTTLLVNEENSGGVFHQWEKGFKQAKGDIVWIAESDDWCSEDFLETLVPFFENEAIQLAYSRTVFMDSSGSERLWSINEYLHDIDPERWSSPFVETANNIVAEAFAIKNVIPNASSAIFRNPGPLELLQDPQWKAMRTCGDWIFYLHLIRGGVMAYSPDACNYYRIHDENTSVNSHSDDIFYAEHELVAKTVQKYYRVDSDVFSHQKNNLIAHWRATRPSFSEQDFDACYSLSRIKLAESERVPNLLMAAYGFCTGGGETFPVELANLMKEADYNVTYLDCAQEPRNEGVRKNLRIDIPVVSDIAQLEKIVSDFGIDIIHSHHAWVDSSILDMLPEEVGCKTIVTLHGMYETINNVDLKFILPRLVSRSACLIYVADKNLSALKTHKLVDDAKLVRIENALSITDFEPVLRSELGIPENAFVLTLISRAMEEKGWQEAIEIVTMARKISETDVHLLLVGDGVEYDRLSGLELPAFIHLKGFQRNVQGYFAVADMGFLPSKFRGESFPLVVIECLQSGRPILASALGDIPYMLSSPDGAAGVLVDLNGSEINIPLWAEKVNELASEEDLYESLLSRVTGAADKFDSSVMARKHDEVYRSVLRGSEG